MKYRTILLIGSPGAGKGTQGKTLGSIPGLYHCACGDVFRNLRADDELGRTFVEYSSRGELVPDEATVRLWRQSIDAVTRMGRFQPAKDAMVLDGIPRNVQQAKMLEEAIELRAIINLVCPDQNKLIARLQRRALHENRLDDVNLETIRNRLAVYEAQTKPVLDFYGSQLTHTIDGTQPPMAVLRDILNVLINIL